MDSHETVPPEDWYRLVVEFAPNGLIVVSHDGVIEMVNRGAELLFGFDRAELVGRPIGLLVPARFHGGHAAAIRAFAADPRARPMGSGQEIYGLRKDGSEVAIEVGLNPIETAHGRFTVASIIDISERRRSEAALRESHAEAERARAAFEALAAQRSEMLEASRHRQQAILDALPSMIGYWDAGLINRFANAAYQSWFGVEGRSLEGRHMRELLGPEIFELNRPHFEAALRGEPQTFERSIPRPGSTGLRHSLAHYLPDVTAGGEVRGFHALVHDVTEIVESRRTLSAGIKEREVLLQEVHHRVKNNLQVITSLLNMQVRRLGPGEARDSIEECRRRVMIIALIHQQLYESHDYSSVDFGRYLRSLAASTFRLGDTSGAARMTLDLEEVPLEVGLAIPCALLVNELVTNALKHAFAGRDAGSVRVSLARDGDLVRLEVADDGRGLPEGFEITTAKTMGYQLVCTLAAQLRGKLAVAAGPGTTIRLSFPMVRAC